MQTWQNYTCGVIRSFNVPKSTNTNVINSDIPLDRYDLRALRRRGLRRGLLEGGFEGGLRRGLEAPFEKGSDFRSPFSFLVWSPPWSLPSTETRRASRSPPSRETRSPPSRSPLREGGVYSYGQFSWIVACSARCINRLHRRINACGSADYSATWHRNRIDIGGLKIDSWRASVFATCVPIFGLAW